MSEAKTYLPLGSIVIMKGALKKLMIISRANVLNDKLFEYGAILYPEGMIDENIAYFNREDIIKVVHEGFSDEDDELIVQEINTAVEQLANQEKVAQVQVQVEEVVIVEEEIEDDDPFAGVRDLEG